MKKPKKIKGKPRGLLGGRKQKYNEPTTTIRVPVSKVSEIKKLISE